MHTFATRKKEAEVTDGSLEMAADHGEKYQPEPPNGQTQSEHFAQDQSLSMEGRLVRFRPPPGNEEELDSTQYRQEFYSSLSQPSRLY